jgi:type IV fimbrial biogenesis protein FimT
LKGELKVRSTHAFSLLELLLALSIVSILASLTFPSLRSLLNRTITETTQSQLTQAIQFANREAHARYVSVGFCLSDNQHTCSDKGREALLIFVDEHENGVIENDQQIINILPLKLSAGYLFIKSYPYYRSYFQFRPDAGYSSDNGHIVYCVQSETKPRWVLMVSQTGRARLLKPGRDGLLRDGSGNALAC